MSEMSPLMLVILKALRVTTLGLAALMLLFLGLTLWQKTKVAGFEALTRADYTFMAVLLAISLAALWMARAISREMRKPGA